jgi:transcriptional regulator with XRE-family HTH domain
MNQSKRKRLEADGWKIGSVAEFLGLSPEEELLVEMKLALANQLRSRRQRLKITQQQLAKQIGSSQSRVAKIEKADKSVSMDLLVSSLASLGASRAEIGGIVGATTATARERSARGKAGGKSKTAFKRTSDRSTSARSGKRTAR